MHTLFQASEFANDQQNRYKIHFPSNLISFRCLFFFSLFLIRSNIKRNILFLKTEIETRLLTSSTRRTLKDRFSKEQGINEVQREFSIFPWKGRGIR